MFKEHFIPIFLVYNLTLIIDLLEALFHTFERKKYNNLRRFFLSHKPSWELPQKFEPDLFSFFDVYWILTNQQASQIYIYICM